MGPPGASRRFHSAETRATMEATPPFARAFCTVEALRQLLDAPAWDSGGPADRTNSMPPPAGVQQPDDRSGDGPGLDPAAWSLKNFVEAAPSSMAMFDAGMRYLAVSPQFLIDN